MDMDSPLGIADDPPMRFATHDASSG
jgi:hypothetical protein